MKQNTQGLPLRVVFQDEARFGRLSDPQRCWAPKPLRPVVTQGVVRQYTYVYAAVTPADGDLVWSIQPKMNTAEAGAFLKAVAEKHADEFVVMVWDGAPSHRANALPVPDNLALIRLPPYAPELNPVEHLWDEVREKHFANRVFDSMEAVTAQAGAAMAALEESPDIVASIAGWPWILGPMESF